MSKKAVSSPLDSPLVSDFTYDLVMRHYRLLVNVVYTLKLHANKPDTDPAFLSYRKYTQQRALTRAIELLRELLLTKGVSAIHSRTSLTPYTSFPPVKGVDFKTHNFTLLTTSDQMLRKVVESMHQAGYLDFTLKKALGLAIELLGDSLISAKIPILELPEAMKRVSAERSASIKAGMKRKREPEQPHHTTSKATTFNFG